MSNWALARGLTRLAGGLAAGSGSTLARAAWSNPISRGAMLGAAGGGALAYSQDRSVLGGMALGAGVGAAGGWARGLRAPATDIWNTMRGAGASRWQSFSAVASMVGERARMDGAASARFLGNTAKRAYGRIRGMF